VDASIATFRNSPISSTTNPLPMSSKKEEYIK
jgi:hypothetical protein